MLSLIKKNLSRWIGAAIVLAVGIICIVAGATNSGSSFDTISVVLGIILTVVGSIGIVLAIASSIVLKKAVLGVALGSGIVLAFGIFLLVNQAVAGLVIGYIVTFIPYLLLVLGSIMFLNLVFTIVFAVKEKMVKSSITAIIFGLLISAAAITLGALSVGSNPIIPGSAQLIIFGVIIILVALLIILTAFVKMPSVVSIVTIKDKE